MRSRLIPAAAAALCALVATTAFAADQEFTLSAAVPKVEWEGAPQVTRGSPVFTPESRNAIPCKTPGARPCEEILLNVADAGKLSIKVEGQPGADGAATDVDLYLFASDKAGTKGDQVASTAAAGDEILTVAKAKAGYYLLVADYYHALNGGYKATATLVSSAPVAAPPAPVVPVVTPAKPAAPAKAPAKKSSAKRKACEKKAKKIKNKRKRSAALKRCKKIKR